MQRIYVTGISGVGKTTLAKRIAENLSLPHYELDTFIFDKNGARNNVNEFVAMVNQLCETDSWVLDGNHRTVRPAIMQAADIVLVLDYSRIRVFLSTRASPVF